MNISPKAVKFIRNVTVALRARDQRWPVSPSMAGWLAAHNLWAADVHQVNQEIQDLEKNGGNNGVYRVGRP
jgi:hypothetical protein